MKYVKKPKVIEAVQWNGSDFSEYPDWILQALKNKDIVVNFDTTIKNGYVLEIETPEGTMEGIKDDFIIQGVKGELYPCKPDIFKESYEEVK